MLFDPATLRDGFKPTGRRYTIAARVSGNVHSAFPAGPPAGVTLPPGQAALKESQKPLSLVVFADSDLLSDYLWVREQNFFGQRLIRALASNGDLVQNALDNLAGSNGGVESPSGRGAPGRIPVTPWVAPLFMPAVLLRGGAGRGGGRGARPAPAASEPEAVRGAP